MMGYYRRPEALVRFRRAGKREGRAQQREDKEVICPTLGGLKTGSGDRVQPQGWILIRAPSPAPAPGAAGWAGRSGGGTAGLWGGWGCSGNTRGTEEDKTDQGTPGGLPEQGIAR